MAAPVSASFLAQQRAVSNIVSNRVFMLFGDYGVVTGAAWSSKGSPTLSDPSVFDSQRWDVADLGHGIRSHRNFGDVDGLGAARGWQGGMKSDVTTGIFPGILIRNLDTPSNTLRTNVGKRLAVRAQAPTPGGGVVSVDLRQFAMRVSATGAPGAANIRIQGDAVGLPNGINLASFVLTTGNVVDGFFYATLAAGAVSLAPGAFFWIVLDDATGTGPNHWNWTSADTATGAEYSAEFIGAGPWASTAYRTHYRTAFTWVGAPTSAEHVTVTFPTARKVNRVRIYSYPSSRTTTDKGIAIARVLWGNGGVFGLSTILDAKASDYNVPAATVAFGGGIVSGIDGTFVDVKTTDATADALRLEITTTQSLGDFARLIAVEIYYEQDISGRVTSSQVSARRDSFLRVDEGSILDLECSNDDRFFSPLYRPMGTQVAAGFLNAEILPNVLFRVDQGFATNERVPLGEFLLDDLVVAAKGRQVRIKCRDQFKRFENTMLGERLRFYDRIEDLIEIVGNRANTSSSRMVLAETETRVTIWMPQGLSAREEVDELCKSAPLATCRFDGFGIFRMITFLPNTMTLGELPQAAGAQPLDVYATRQQALGGTVLEQTTPWTHALLVNDRAFVALMRTSGAVNNQFAVILEYDVALRTFREIKNEGGDPNADATVRYNFGNLAVDDTVPTNLFYTRKERALKTALSSLATTTLDLSTLGIPGFSKTSTYCGLGLVASGRYYFAFEAAGNIRLGSCDTALTGASFVNHGILITGGLRLQRMVRWTAGGFDRIYFAAEDGTLTNTYYDLTGAALVNDGVTRRGVTTDGTYLYELLVQSGGSHVLRRRDSAAALVAVGSVPENTDLAGIGPCIGWAANRIFAVYRTATRHNVVREFYLLDTGFFEQDLPEPRQASAISEDRVNGRFILLDQNEPWTTGPLSGLVRSDLLKLRMFGMPNAPVSEDLAIAWNDQMLDASGYRLSDQNAGQGAVLTRIRWTLQPWISNQQVVVWRATSNGQVISPTNPVNLSTVTPWNDLFGKPRYVSVRHWMTRLRLPLSTDFAGYPCPTNAPGASGPGVSVSSTGVSTFGPQNARNQTPTPSIPQQLNWTTRAGSGSLTATLTPHPTTPELVITPTGVLLLTGLWISSLPYQRADVSMIEVDSGDVFSDGAALRAQNGDDAEEIRCDYISEPGILILAAKELLRLYGRPQHQFSSVTIVAAPQIGLEDIVHVTEPESGVSMRFQVTGIEHVYAVSGEGATIETRLTLLALATISNLGLGQGIPTPTQLGPVPD